MTRVVVAEDHHLVRQGLRALLERDADVRVVGEAGDGRTAVELARELEPDVLVMDVGMPRLGGLQATEQLQSLGLPTAVIILSMHGDEALVRQALRSGARGYLLKTAVAEELMLAIRAAMRGDIYLSPAISRTLVGGILDEVDDSEEATLLEQLTPREKEVLQLVAEGCTNAAIAQELHVSIKTVEKHRRSVMTKLNVHDLAGLVRSAVRLKLVFLDDVPRL